MMVIKAQRPALLISYPMLFFNALVMVASSAACAPFSPLLSGIVLYAAVLLRIGVGYTAARMLSLRPKASDLLFGILIADVLLVIAFIKALGTRRFNWRGRWLTISGGGELKDVG
jgi:ceramide glucosyltransferase